MTKPTDNDVRASDMSGGRNRNETEESSGGEHTPNGADLNDQGVEVTNVSFAHMSIQALSEMMGRPANFYENEEVEDDDEDGDEDVYGQEVQLSPTSAARGSPAWMVPTAAAAGAAVTKLRSSNRKTKIIVAVGTSIFLIMFCTGLGGIISTNKAVVSQANLVDDCVTTAPTTKSGKGSTSPTGKSDKTVDLSRRRMDSLRGVYGNSELGPKTAYLMELRTGSAKYSGGGGEEDIMERNLSSTSKQPSTGKSTKSTYSPNSKGGKGSKCNTSRAPTTSGKGGKSGPPGAKSGKGTSEPSLEPSSQPSSPPTPEPSSEQPSSQPTDCIRNGVGDLPDNPDAGPGDDPKLRCTNINPPPQGFFSPCRCCSNMCNYESGNGQCVATSGDNVVSCDEINTEAQTTTVRDSMMVLSSNRATGGVLLSNGCKGAMVQSMIVLIVFSTQVFFWLHSG